MRFKFNFYLENASIVLAMIGVSNRNKTSYKKGVQSRTDAYI